MWDVSKAVFLVARSRDLIPRMMFSIIGQAFPPSIMATWLYRIGLVVAVWSNG